MKTENRDLVVSRSQLVNERVEANSVGYIDSIKAFYKTTDCLDGWAGLTLGASLVVFVFSFAIALPQHVAGSFWLAMKLLQSHLLILQTYVTWPLFSRWRENRALAAKESQKIITDGQYSLALVERAKGVLEERVSSRALEIEQVKTKLQAPRAILDDAQKLISEIGNATSSVTQEKTIQNLASVKNKLQSLESELGSLKQVESKLKLSLKGMEVQAKLLRASELLDEATGDSVAETGLLTQFNSQLLELSQMCDMVKQIGISAGQDTESIVSDMLQIEELKKD